MSRHLLQASESLATISCMRYGIFVNKFLVADFPNGKRREALIDAFRREGEFFDFWTNESIKPEDMEERFCGQILLRKAAAIDYLRERVNARKQP